MSILTMKFGGTSVGTAAAIEQVAQIVQQNVHEGHQVATIVSAMAGVTNTLIKAARDAEIGQVMTYRQAAQEMEQRHVSAAEALVSVTNKRQRLIDEIRGLLEDFEQLCHSISIMHEVTPRGMDVVSSLGERLSVRLVAAHFEELGLTAPAIESTALILTNDRFQNAAPDMAATRERIQSRLMPLLTNGASPVITGFIGATPKGTITTLGRGGSDYSAGIIAACIPSDELWIWTDVDGVMTTDPRITKQARTIGVLSYGEVSEMAYFGAKVLHPRTILPVIDLGMPIRVLNTFNPTHSGTLIQPEPQIISGGIRAITTIQDVHLLKVYGRGMIGVAGMAGRTFTAVARAGASMLMFAQSSSEQSFCFVVPEDMSAAVKAEIQAELSIERARADVEDVLVREDVVILTIIGAGMREMPGIAARIFGALGEAQINILSIAQGLAEHSLSLVIDHTKALDAIHALHSLLINGED